MSINLLAIERFEDRHHGSDAESITEMLSAINVGSIEELIDETVPKSIRLTQSLDLPLAVDEQTFLKQFRQIASKNKVAQSYIGMGYYDTVLPPVIQRNILENPGWYTAYTPYQAEIAQGRLEMLITFQTLISELTGLEIANASLLDEATAAAEAMSMLYAVRKGSKKKEAETLLVSDTLHPHTIDVLKTRAEPVGINLEIVPVSDFDVSRSDVFAIMIQNPDTFGQLTDSSDIFAQAAEHQVFSASISDLMSLLLVKSPGEMGADVVVGSAQRFGVPMGFGGPHAAFFATKEEFKRQMPGRIIGVTKDMNGNPAFRMALQTREQHIRREKATSNICTAQVLLAVISAAYAVYHGPDGLRNIAERIHSKTVLVASILRKAGYNLRHSVFFDTLVIDSIEPNVMKALRSSAAKKLINLRYIGSDSISLSLDEAKTIDDIQALVNLFAQATGYYSDIDIKPMAKQITSEIPAELKRSSTYLTHPVFSLYHTEHEMLRYLKHLENKDLSLTHSMISLGSCTMKLNATTEMIPITWPELCHIHPFAPENQVQGYKEIINNLSNWLKEITGFQAISLQPNSGAQGEYSGLMVIRAYHKNCGESHRNIILIPSSAHGTNPASAIMAGMQVVVVACDSDGNIDSNDLKSKAEKYKDNLAALMVTYPSTHGVFEEGIKELCQIIHDNGGLVYMDGANMNAQVGLTSPGEIGADVCHLNLHKTFCVPHGGGGPGMGPIGVNEKLKPFLPGHTIIKTGGDKAISQVSAAPFGSADILAISYAYIALMGVNGLKHATERAILNANYIKARLENHYSVLYTGKNGRTAHELIIDFRPFKQSAGVEVIDAAKRLMDYGFHAPTVSFPVAGTMMIEPTESETKAELDRFCNAMISIRNEIREIEEGKADKKINVLKQAPHTAEMLLKDNWELPYSREKAAFPLDWVRVRKFWPSVRRVDDAYGDRNLICSCPPMEMYEEMN